VHQRLRWTATASLGLPAGACAGERGVEGPTCEALGCCWAPDPLPKQDWQPDVYLPECFHPNTGASTYTLGEAGAGVIQTTGARGVQLLLPRVASPAACGAGKPAPVCQEAGNPAVPAMGRVN
jgi:hypothetical protein